MARRATSGRGGDATGGPASLRDRALQSAMTLAAERPWGEVTLGDIARHAGLTLAQLYEAYGSKSTIVAALMQKADAEVLIGADPSVFDEPARERVMDAVMRRLDALAPYKPAIDSILRELPRDPVAALCVLPGFLDSMAWTLEAAGIGTAGLGGRLRANGLAAIYAATVRVWLDDDSPDQGRTMAYLDRRLRQAEHIVPYLPDGRRRSRPPPA